MPETARLPEASDLIAAAAELAAQAMALIGAGAQDTAVTLVAVALRELRAELDRLQVTARILAEHGELRHAEGVEAGIAIGRALAAAERAGTGKACSLQLVSVR